MAAEKEPEPTEVVETYTTKLRPVYAQGLSTGPSASVDWKRQRNGERVLEVRVRNLADFFEGRDTWQIDLMINGKMITGMVRGFAVGLGIAAIRPVVVILQLVTATDEFAPVRSAGPRTGAPTAGGSRDGHPSALSARSALPGIARTSCRTCLRRSTLRWKRLPERQEGR